MNKGGKPRAGRWQTMYGCLASVLILFFPLATVASECSSFLSLPDADEVLSATISGKQSHCYRVVPGNDDRLVIAFAQRGAIDVRIEASSGAVLDSPMHYFGDELWFASAHQNVDWIRIRSTAPAGINERYVLKVRRLEPVEVAIAKRHGELLAEAGDHKRIGALARELLDVAAQWHELDRASWGASATHLAGYLLWRDGDAESAYEVTEQASDWYLRIGEHENAAMVMNHRAMIALDLARFDEANRLLERALPMLDDENPDATAAVLNNQGLVHHYQGDLEQARALYLRAADLNEALGQPQRRLSQLNNIGGIHFVRGEAAAARQYFQEVARIGREYGMLEPEISALGNLGIVQFESGAYSEALSTFTHLLELCDRAADKRCTGRTLNRIGQTYLEMGDFPRAREYLEQAREQRERLDDRRGLAQTFRHMARLNLESGDHAAARAATTAGLELDSSPADKGKLELVFGRLQLAQRDCEAAGGAFERALDLLKEAGEQASAAMAQLMRAEADVHCGGEIDQREITALSAVFQDAGVIDREIHLHYVLALAAHARGQRMEALREIERAQALIEDVRASIPVPSMRQVFSFTRSRVRDLHVQVLMELHFRQPDAGHALQALFVADAARSRNLAEILDGREVSPNGASAEMVSERRELAQQLSFRLSRRAGKAEDDHEIARWRARLDALDGQMLANRRPAVLAQAGGTSTMLGELQGRLGPDAALLNYYLGADESYAWVISKESLTVARLPAAAVIERQVRDVREAVEQRSANTARRAEVLSALAETVLDPVRAALSDYSRWHIVADGALQTAPFAALPDNGGEPLVTHHILHFITTLKDEFAHARRNDLPAKPRAVIVSDPIYDAGDARLADVAGEMALQRDAGRLRATAREAAAISEGLGRPVNNLEGFAASRELLHDPDLRNADVIHFAVHGVFDTDAPAMSGLLVSRFNAEGVATDGFIGLRDIYAMDLTAGLVVLSGCETGLGRQLRGEGVLGMTGGFLAAGAGNVVASLWRIPDGATASFMQHFYAALKHQAPAIALRQAQQLMRESRRYRHPYYWSGFVLTGFLPEVRERRSPEQLP